MRPQHKRKKAYRFGLAAERLGCYYLRSKGYRVLAERYRNHYGEIDIVAAKGKLLVIVEVKARGTLAACEYSVTPHKQQKILRATTALLSGQHAIRGLADLAGRDIRFDVLWLAPWRWPVHIKDAWRS